MRFVAALVVMQLLVLAVIASGELYSNHQLQSTKSESLSDAEIVQILQADPTSSVDEFVKFKDKYHKIYSTREEVEKRYTIFTANVKYINEQNKKHLSYKLGINQWTDLTPEEFAAAHGMNSTRPGGGRGH